MKFNVKFEIQVNDEIDKGILIDAQCITKDNVLTLLEVFADEFKKALL